MGFRTKWFEYENVERVAGQTKWNFWKLFLYSIEGIVGFSTAPLAIAALVGVLFCLAAFVGILFILIRYALGWQDPVAGWQSMTCIILLCSGVQLFCTGILGEYLAKTYLEVKHRPLYVVKETEENQSSAEFSFFRFSATLLTKLLWYARFASVSGRPSGECTSPVFYAKGALP